MSELEMRAGRFWAHSAAIATNHQENTMATTADFDELSGRIDGIGQALLRLTAELEMQGVIDGSRVSAAWIRAAQPHTGDTAVHHSSHKTLAHLVQLLDDARGSRLSR
jgi:hypothetical protein